MPDLFDVIGTQRACRAFRTDPVDDALVEQVLRAATHAPSAENRQPWRFVVVRDPDRRAALADLARRAWEEGAYAHSVERLEPTLLAEVDRAARSGLADAPVAIVVCADGRDVHPSVIPASIFPALQNLLLAAAALGLGSVLTTLPLTRADELRALVALPDFVVPIAVVPIGWPAKALKPARRRPVAEVAYRDTYGTPW